MSRFKTTAFFVCFGLGTACLWIYSSAARVVNVEDDSGNVVFSSLARPGERFTIRFIHSVAKSPVEEIFEITGDDGFQLRETVYADFGAGLPFEDSPERRMEFKNGRIRLSGFSMDFHELQLRVGRVAEHALLMEDGRELFLASVAEPGSAVRISAPRCSYGRWLVWRLGALWRSIIS